MSVHALKYTPDIITTVDKKSEILCGLGKTERSLDLRCGRMFLIPLPGFIRVCVIRHRSLVVMEDMR